MSRTDPTLASVAELKQHWDKQRDSYLSKMAPFYVEHWPLENVSPQAWWFEKLLAALANLEQRVEELERAQEAREREAREE